MELKLKFPFVVVEPGLTPGDPPNVEEVLAACPPNFYESKNPWSVAAAVLIEMGVEAVSLTPPMNERRAKKLYLMTWMRTRLAYPDQRRAVVAWLLSLMVEGQPEEMEAATGIQFPFVEVTDLQKLFGGVPNYEAALEACPREFFDQHNPWTEFAGSVYHRGVDAVDWNSAEMRVGSVDEAVAKRDYIVCWQTSMKPSHQEKEAMMGWLFSLLFKEVPKLK